MTIQIAIGSQAGRERNRVGAIIAFLFCLGSSAFGFWLAVVGPPLGGGLPWLLPDAWNQFVGRMVFGVSGVLCLAIGGLAYRDMRR